MKRVLVTGGAGFIGSHACKALSQAGFEPVTFDNLSRGHREAVRWGPFVQGDLRAEKDIEDALARYRPNAVMHFAAVAYVPESVLNPMLYYANNVMGTLNLVSAMVQHEIRAMVFSSSCTTYGVPESVPIPESARLDPISPYGWSKRMGEQILADAAGGHAMSYAILRYFNASGADPDGQLVEDHDPETHLIPLTVDAALRNGPALKIFGTDYPTPDGTCIRDYIHVTDLAAAHVGAAQHLLDGKQSFTANLGTGRGASVHEMIAAVERVSGRQVPVEFAERRPGDPPVLVADASQARRLLGFEPRYSDLETIVATTLRSRAATGAGDTAPSPKSTAQPPAS